MNDYDYLKNKISISMLIDNDIKKNNYVNNVKFKPLPLKNSINIDERRIYKWVKDENVNNCYNCGTKFNIINRKHHCRNCGKIFCFKCVNNFISIPNNLKTVPKEYNYLDYNTYIDFFNINNGEEKVCKKCYDKIFELKEINKTIYYFDQLPLDINDYKNISLVCKSWNKVSKYYFSYFREIQYFFPDHKFNNKEKRIIHMNKLNFSCHSKWLLQLILIIDWENHNSILKQKILSIIKSEKKHKNCWEMMCTRSCSKKLQTEDIIIILSKKFTYFPLIKYLISLLYDSTEIEISCYLSYLVSLLYFYKNFTNINNELTQFLLNKCSKNTQLSNQLFWTLTQGLSDADNYNFLKNLRQDLVNLLPKTNYILFQNGYDFTLNLIQIAKNSSIINLTDKLKKYLDTYNFNNQFNLPIDVSKTFKKIDIKKIRSIDSKTKPIILPCKYENDKIFNIMLKKEDIRKEEIIMKIIKLMDLYLKKEANLDLNITTYNILPISNEYGYIEFVPNSTTLYDIREVSQFSIQNFILEKNPNMNINNFRDRYSKSCAAYCVITYLLGIGDRHLDNIMITDDGCIFHIDFGYILGRDPKPLSPEIRITPEMIDAMGGPKSYYFKMFKEYSGKAYNCLRRHAPIFYILLLNLTNLENEEYTKEQIRNHIIQRFIPGENYKDANKQFSNKLDMNFNTYSEGIIDYFHKKCKSNSSSNSNPLNNTIIQNAIDITNNARKNLSKKITSMFDL